MGLTIENKHSSIDLSYTGFARLRTKIAYLHSKELGKFYDELVNAIPMFGKEREIFLKDYEKRLSTIDEELNVSHYLLDFLYADDYEATMSVKHCRSLGKVILSLIKLKELKILNRQDLKILCLILFFLITDLKEQVAQPLILLFQNSRKNI